ncbi:hypothetical protein GH714_034075 [Hevea brasiliensis]|uniref:K Homology domain-containing protein n=1 Tax=Hevea brasiliensis TaxID=3981 RepID=A0A6A6L6A2_HEVBR|nr:hypothetical protein GH714_034075 [Hevea brasiliensis]
MQHRDYQFSSHRPRRCPRPPQPILLQPGQVAFRVICHVSIIGGLIGPSGSIISQIRRDTDCAIRCEELVQGSDHRVIVVIGPASPGRRIALKSMEGDDEDEKELVSVAQEAVIRVCERMWGLALIADGLMIVRGAKCGLWNKNIGSFFPCEKDFMLWQITGDILAVKKALVAVTECLHDCPPYNKEPMLLNRPVERASHISSSDLHAEFFPHLSSLLPPLIENSANSHSLSSDADEDPNQDVKSTRQEVSFRLLCSNGAAGSIIGKKGTIVRTLQNETGASIMFAAPITMSGARVVTISAFENLESSYSPAQKAVILVFARSIEHDIEKGHSSGLIKGSTVTARLLVASDVVCCLIGNGGGIDSEMTELADIRILEGKHVMDCTSENDVVIEITGEYKNVQNALFLVTRKLRDNLSRTELLNEVRTRSPHGRVMEIASPRLQQPILSLNSDRECSLKGGMDRLGLSNNLGNASSSDSGHHRNLEKRMQQLLKIMETAQLCLVGVQNLKGHFTCFCPKREPRTSLTKNLCFVNNIACSGIGTKWHLNGFRMHVTTLRAYSSLRRRKRSAIVANTTLELIVSEDILGSIYGDDGNNLARLTGARVEVRDPSPSKSERMVVISGTPDQTRQHRACFKPSF